MNDLIDRRAVIDAIKNQTCLTYEEIFNRCLVSITDENGWLGGIKDAIEAVIGLPSVQPERKKGKWIDKSGGIEGAWNYCSVCGEQAIDLYDFCPNCGADMRGEEHETD